MATETAKPAAAPKQPKIDQKALAEFADGFLTGKKPEAKKKEGAEAEKPEGEAEDKEDGEDGEDGAGDEEAAAGGNEEGGDENAEAGGDEESDEDKAAKAEAAKAAAAKAAKKKPAAPAPAAPMDAKELGKAIGEGVATALDKRDANAKKAGEEKGQEQPGETAHLSDTNKRRYEVLQQLETDHPEKYKGLAGKFSASVKSLADYAAKWKAKNPGKEFDEEADEHTEFMAQNDEGVDWDDEEFDDAKVNLRVSKVTAESRKEVDKKLSDVELAEKARKLAPAIQKAQTEAGVEFFSHAGEDYSGVLNEDGSINEGGLAAMQEKHPVAAPIILAAAGETEHLSGVVTGLYEGAMRFDPQNKAHIQVDRFITDMEKRLAAKPEDERLNAEGKDFLPSIEYFKLKPEERKHFWTYEPKDINAILAARIAKNATDFAKKRIAEIKKEAERLGYRKTEEPENQEEQPEPKPRATKPGNGKPRSPSITEKPIVTTGKGANGGGPKNGPDAWLKDF